MNELCRCTMLFGMVEVFEVLGTPVWGSLVIIIDDENISHAAPWMTWKKIVCRNLRTPYSLLCISLSKQHRIASSFLILFSFD